MTDGILCIGSEQSTCPSSQHSTCLASQQGRCLGSQQGTISLLNTRQNLLCNSLSFSTVSLYSTISLYSTASLYSPVSLYSTVSLDSGQVFFLGKIKACLACKQPHIKDKIPSKVTSDGLKWKSDFSWKSGWCIVKMHIKWWFWWKSHIKRIHLRSFS